MLGSSRVQIAVGYDAALKVGVLPSTLAKLGLEGHAVVSTGLAKNVRVALSGGPKGLRGTIYAAYSYLEAVGFRFYARDDTLVPSLSRLPGELLPFPSNTR